jgi:hypothetical protein
LPEKHRQRVIVESDAAVVKQINKLLKGMDVDNMLENALAEGQFS